MDHFAGYPLDELRTFQDWSDAISKTIPAEDMLAWFAEVLDGVANDGQFKPWTLNQWCAAQHRFRELAHFSKKLTPSQRQSFIEQADMIVGLIRDFYGKDQAAMARFNAALAASAERNALFGWPSAIWETLDFDEL